MKRAARLAIVLVGLMVIGAAAAVAAFQWAVTAMPGPLTAGRNVVIAKGSVLPEIADQLAEAGVVVHPLLFRLAADVSDTGQPLQAGEYAFAAGTTVSQALELLRSGRTVVRKLTIPEGLTNAQVVRRLQEAMGLEGDVGPLPEEGGLYPATYPYTWGDSRAAMMAKMTQAMQLTLGKLWAKRAANLPLNSPRDAVTLASIVEKETALAAERPRIAGVFVNRLRAGMRLQSDPTVIYAMAGGQGPLGRPLTRTDLLAEHPYNTYRNAGLPPGPIANPGRAALAAVLQPAATDDLFFVADGSGGHAFARTYEEHRLNVARWRALQADDSDRVEGEGGN